MQSARKKLNEILKPLTVSVFCGDNDEFNEVKSFTLCNTTVCYYPVLKMCGNPILFYLYVYNWPKQPGKHKQSDWNILQN